MQKVVGSSPIIRFRHAPRKSGGFCLPWGSSKRPGTIQSFVVIASIGSWTAVAHTLYPPGMALGDEKYMLLTTFRRDGRPVATPVWAVKLDGDDVGFWTSSGSGKAKRLAHTARVTVQPCDARGRVKPGSAATGATARLVTGSEFEAIRTRVLAKYGAMTKITKALGTIAGIVRGKRIPYGDMGVVVTPTPGS
jgi:PPOX class probable F420-dependent enzyme